QTERAGILVPPGDDLLTRLAAQHAGDMRHAESLADAGHARENLTRDHHGIHGWLELVEAVVARPAAICKRAVSEVLSQISMTAAHARRITFHRPQKISGGVGELTVPLQHRTPFHEVG